MFKTQHVLKTINKRKPPRSCLRNEKERTLCKVLKFRLSEKGLQALERFRNYCGGL
jgi:hypothetical protein